MEINVWITEDLLTFKRGVLTCFSFSHEIIGVFFSIIKYVKSEKNNLCGWFVPVYSSVLAYVQEG